MQLVEATAVEGGNVAAVAEPSVTAGTTYVVVPIAALAALVESAERVAEKHPHLTPNEWPGGVPCSNCTALAAVRPLVSTALECR